MKFRFVVPIVGFAVLASGYAVAQVVTSPPAGTVVVAQPAPVIVAAQPYCRPFKETFTIEGRTQVGRGTACLQSDGSWQITSLAGGLTYLSRGNGVYIMAPQPFVEERVIIGRAHRYHD